MSVVRFDKAEVRCSFASVLSWTTWDCRVDAFRFTPARTVAAGPRICRGITVRSLITHVWWNLSTPSCTYTFWGVYRSIVCLFILHIKIAVCLHYHGCWDCQGEQIHSTDVCCRPVLPIKPSVQLMQWVVPQVMAGCVLSPLSRIQDTPSSSLLHNWAILPV